MLSPRITRSLRNQAAMENSTVELAPVADGSEPLTYQWRLNGNLLADVTPNLVITASNNTAGVYTFTAVNDAGSASTSATLAII
jgi:membrane carboxypeptidase/penicillin-binding protein PbpC